MKKKFSDIENVFKTLITESGQCLSLDNKCVRHGIKVTVAALLALLTSQFLELPKANWSAWTATTVMLPDIASSTKKLASRFFGTLTAFVISIILFGTFFQNHIYMSIAYGLFILIACYKIKTSNVDYYWWVVASVVLIVSLGALQSDPYESINIATYRAIEISIGVFYAFCINFWLWPNYTQSALSKEAVKYRNSFTDKLKLVVDSFTSNSYNNSEKIISLFKNDYKDFTKISQLISKSKIERKVARIKDYDKDMNSSEIFYLSNKLLRFYKTVLQHKIYTKNDLKLFFTDLVTLISELTFQVNTYKVSSDINSLSNIKSTIDEIDIKINKASMEYFSSENNEKYNVISAVGFNIIFSYFMLLKQSVFNNIKTQKKQSVFTTLETYTYLKCINFFGVNICAYIPNFKQALKTAIYVVLSIWFLFYFQMSIDEAGVYMLLFAVMFMNYAIVKKFRTFFCLAMGVVAATLFNLLMMGFIPDNPPILYIILTIVIFFFSFLRAMPDKDIQFFAILALVGILGCQTGAFTPLDNPWPILTSLTGGIISIISIYLMNRFWWSSNIKDESIKQFNNMSLVFSDIYKNFKLYIKGYDSFFDSNMGFTKLYDSVSQLRIEKVISEEEYNKYFPNIKAITNLYVETKFLLIFNKEGFNYFFKLNPKFFLYLFKYISQISMDNSTYKNNMLFKLKNDFQIIKQTYKQDCIDTKNINIKFNGEALIIIRRILNLLNILEADSISCKAEES